MTDVFSFLQSRQSISAVGGVNAENALVQPDGVFYRDESRAAGCVDSDVEIPSRPRLRRLR
jgi:hypothetical protein